MANRLLCALWWAAWWWRFRCRGVKRVVRVRGWRTALLDLPAGDRATVTPMFWFDKETEDE